jgi:NAD dependent epimerase/dehydratase family enzyme
MSKHILITGGTGLVGTKLTRLLLDKGYSVSHLSRKIADVDSRVHTYLWDVNKGEIDEHAVDGVDVIVHLAGANVADGRWTNDRKKEIIRSRTKSIELIYKLMRQKNRIPLTPLYQLQAQATMATGLTNCLPKTAPPAPISLPMFACNGSMPLIPANR